MSYPDDDETAYQIAMQYTDTELNEPIRDDDDDITIVEGDDE
jgi:hypothetical protein